MAESLRSRYAEYFNHDADAADYDVDVTREEHPIRAGYSEVLEYVGRWVPPDATVLDLGSGTGNTILALPESCSVTAVDVSREMTRIAVDKTSGRRVRFVEDDLLEYVMSNPLAGFDCVVSTYALHHLTPGERELLFQRLGQELPSGAQIVIGDLMFENEEDRGRVLSKHMEAYPSLEEDISDEFFWNIESSKRMLSRLGLAQSWRRISDLSWALNCSRRSRR